MAKSTSSDEASAAAALMGKRGGDARRDAMTPEERKASARKAAMARWGTNKASIKMAGKVAAKAGAKKAVKKVGKGADK